MERKQSKPNVDVDGYVRRAVREAWDVLDDATSALVDSGLAFEGEGEVWQANDVVAWALGTDRRPAPPTEEEKEEAWVLLVLRVLPDDHRKQLLAWLAEAATEVVETTLAATDAEDAVREAAVAATPDARPGPNRSGLVVLAEAHEKAADAWAQVGENEDENDVYKTDTYVEHSEAATDASQAAFDLAVSLGCTRSAEVCQEAFASGSGWDAYAGHKEEARLLFQLAE